MKKLVSLIAFALVSLLIMARPASRHSITVTQSDGYTFQARIQGDEYMKIMTLLDGTPIVKGENGDFYYATYIADAKKVSTGVKVGSGAPSRVSIPYAALSDKAAALRSRNFSKLPQVVSREASFVPQSAATVRGIVVLVEFSNKKFQSATVEQDFRNMLNQKGYAANGGRGSAKDYFEEQFPGVEFTFDVVKAPTLSNTYQYYGKNDSDDYDVAPEKMIVDACRAVDDKVNFAQYSSDGKYVDFVFVFYAGQGESDSNDSDTVWPQQINLVEWGQNVSLDGVTLNNTACSSELEYHSNGRYSMTGIGTFCHEFSHVMGLMDMYDTDYESAGGGITAAHWLVNGVMDGGSANEDGTLPCNYSVVDKFCLTRSDIVTPYLIRQAEIVNLKAGNYTIAPQSASDNKIYVIAAASGKEWFLFEVRDNKGWDAGLTGSGLLVYHVDNTSRLPWTRNTVNSKTSHQYADLIEANGQKDYWTSYNSYANAIYNHKNVFFPAGSSQLTEMKFFDGSVAPYSITGITKNSDGSVSFKVVSAVDPEETVVPNPVMKSYDDSTRGQNFVIVKFKADKEPKGNVAAYVTLDVANDPYMKTLEAEYDDRSGFYWVRFDDLAPETVYEVSAFFKDENTEKKSESPVQTSFITKKFIGGAPRLSLDYLGIENLPKGEKIASVEYFFDGKPYSISTFEKLSFVQKGTLHVKVTTEKGGVYNFYKEVR